MKDVLTLLAWNAAGLAIWFLIIAPALTGQGIPLEFVQ